MSPMPQGNAVCDECGGMRDVRAKSGLCRKCAFKGSRNGNYKNGQHVIGKINECLGCNKEIGSYAKKFLVVLN